MRAASAAKALVEAETEGPAGIPPVAGAAAAEGGCATCAGTAGVLVTDPDVPSRGAAFAAGGTDASGAGRAGGAVGAADLRGGLPDSELRADVIDDTD
jgi:hypothetical protein